MVRAMQEKAQAPACAITSPVTPPSIGGPTADQLYITMVSFAHPFCRLEPQLRQRHEWQALSSQ
jgi:hypothetical protein